MVCLLFLPLFFWGPHYVTSSLHRPWMFYAVLQPVLLAFGLLGILSRSSSEVPPQPCPVYSASKAAFSAQGLHLAFPSGSPLEFPPLCSLSDLHTACFIRQRPQHTSPGRSCFFFYGCWVFLTAWALLFCSGEGCPPAVARRLLLAGASAVVSTGCRLCGPSSHGPRFPEQRLSSCDRVMHGLSCSAACGLFPDQELNPCPLRWQHVLYH